jgi:anti-sigma B factor antagonist
VVTFQTAPSGPAGIPLRGADATPHPIELARSAGHLSVIVEPFDEHGAYIAVDGEIDACSSQPLRDAITRAIDANHRHLIIDLTGTTFCDCGTFRALSDSVEPLRGADDSAVILVGAHGIVQRLLDFVDAGRSFPCCPDRETARRALRIPLTTNAWRRGMAAP